MGKEKKQIIENDIHVKLKPILGIKPGVYLTVIYGVILLFLMFLILILPGIRNNGTRISVNTIPDKSLVFVDKQYKGTTPCNFFVEKGNHTITIEKDFFNTITIQQDIKGRIPFSLIFPRRIKLDKKLTFNDSDGFLKKRYHELSGYALIRDYYDRYQYPELISQTVKEFMQGTSPGEMHKLYDFLYSLRYNLGNKEIIKDLAEAIKLLEPDKNNSSISAYKTIKDFYDRHGFNTQRFVLSYISSFSEKERDNRIKLEKLNDDLKIALKEIPSNFYLLKDPASLSSSPPSFSFSGFNFFPVPSGRYSAGLLNDNTSSLRADAGINYFPHKESVSSFYMLGAEVNKKQFAMFLNDNPDWQLSSLNKLQEKKLVSEDYLLNFSSVTDDIPVAYISWYAADAFCKWLTTQLPESLSNYEVRLPSEAEWEWAAKLDQKSGPTSIFIDNAGHGPIAPNFQRQGSLRFTDLLGNLWEWCDNYYYPADTAAGTYGLSDSFFKGEEKAVRGGGWANNADEISVITRGSQNPSWCTPFLGFRPVLAEKGK